MKPKREITLGELQDECKECHGICETACAIECGMYDICKEIGKREKPLRWDLTDPPRFTEAQMALLKALWNLGVKKVSRENNDQCFLGDAESWEMSLRDLLDLKYGTLDLAELFGKEARNAN